MLVISENNYIFRRQMKRFISIFVLVLLAQVLVAQTNVQIVGSAANAAGKTVELYCYDDMLSGREVLLDGVQIDSTGHFRLGCYVNYPRLVFMQVEHYSQSFYVEAGRRYEVFIPEFDWDIDERINVHLSPVALPVEFVGVAPDELNMRLSRFDQTVDSLLAAAQQCVSVR